MKKTKIICTLGPSVDDDNILNNIIKAGMDVARFNFSHGDHASQQERVDRIKRVKKENGKDVALLLDTKGPEIRIGKFENGSVIKTADLIEAGLVKKVLCGVKVLGGSKLTKKLTVCAAKFSASAKQAIEEAGGTIEVID